MCESRDSKSITPSKKRILTKFRVDAEKLNLHDDPAATASRYKDKTTSAQSTGIEMSYTAK